MSGLTLRQRIYGWTGFFWGPLDMTHKEKWEGVTVIVNGRGFFIGRN